MELTRLHADKRWFKDEYGRVVILRGVNLGGDSKVPYPDGGTHVPTDFSNHRDVSFIGRPFPLADANEHFTRLKSWGFNLLRLLVTWEAVEHEGPGIHDTAFLDYYATLCKMAGEHGMYVLVDFHEDVWSRMTGGDGAPCWLFEKVGIDYSRLAAADAALVMQHAFDFNDPRKRQEENYPAMCWSQNERYAGNGIMWTLFFAGRIFTPGMMIDQLNVQDYMQSHLLGCMVEVGKRIKDFPNVLGFDSLNEPRRGWIGRPFSERKTKSTRNDPAMLGLAWSPLDALYCSHGHSIDVPYNELSLLKGGFVPKRLVRVNDDRVSIWLPGRTDPFQEAGAWRLDGNGNGTVLHEDFFQVANGKRVDFDRDCMFPFIDRVGESIRNVNPDWMVFAEKDCVSSAFDPSFPESITPNAVNATHWYDNATVGTKKFHYPFTLDVTTKQLVFGTRGIQAMYERNLGDIARASERINGGCPTVIGECGIPYDLDNGKAFREWERGNHGKKIWKSHVMALDLLYNALDALLLSSAQWNYNAHNKNDPLIGDGWNQEDCSIFSEDQHDNPRDINSGGRVLDGFLRPFARRIQGTPLLMMYQRKKGQFTLGLKPDASIARPTEIYVPRYQYPSGITLEAGNADVTIQEGKQLVLIKARDDNELLIKIKGKKNK